MSAVGLSSTLFWAPILLQRYIFVIQEFSSFSSTDSGGEAKLNKTMIQRFDRNDTSVGTRFFSKLLLSAEKGPRLFRSRFRFRCGVTYRVASIPGNFPSLLPEQPQDLLSGDESDARFVRDKTFGEKIIFVAASASDKFCLDKR